MRNGYLSESAASAVLAQPLSLRNGHSLAPRLGFNLSPGPAFIWWQLALGMTLVVVGGLTLGSRRRLDNRWARLAVTLGLLALIIAGLGIAIRSFRSA